MLAERPTVAKHTLAFMPKVKKCNCTTLKCGCMLMICYSFPCSLFAPCPVIAVPTDFSLNLVLGLSIETLA